MIRKLNSFIIALLLLCAIGSVQAGAQATPFFEALYDVPVMNGLEEIKDQAMLFDKPDGRIASVVAVSERLDNKAVTDFYAQTLPELGWKKTAPNQYVRGKDHLALSVVRKGSLTIAHFALSPAAGAMPGR